jgi:UDP-N-acetylmuramoyl-tripeptide--D-alanyl-D-alanine ligase
MGVRVPNWLATGIGVAFGLASWVGVIRWLRVAQREHYIPGRVWIFLRLWLRDSPASVVLVVLGFFAAISTFSPAVPRLGHLVAAAVATATTLLAPLGLSYRGRTGPLVVTARLRRLAAVVLLLDLALSAVGALLGAPLGAAVLAGWLAPGVVDVALRLTAPLERRLMNRFVEAASTTLRRVRPRVVGITGSFGKTTTKGYVAALVEGTYSVVATPASFNNRGGLARAINEHLVPGTEVFVAEMGMFGPGEIAELVAWVRPEISVITAIGPVHLERLGSEAAITRAKLEIVETAHTVVLNIDYPRLALAANALAAEGVRKVIRVSSVSLEADVTVKPNDEGELVVYAGGRKLARAALPDVVPGNLACAVAVALELGVDAEDVAERLARIKPAPNRLVAGVAPASGVEVLDDTYNSNPMGARRALDALAERGRSAKRRVVVTPGMVELGHRQYPENFRFAKAAAQIATHLVVVGKTNRRALEAGAEEGRQEPGATLEELRWAPDREKAVAWVRATLEAGDVVLYENDLPDHYP